MTWSSEVLTRRTTALFDAYCEGDFAHIPSEYKCEGDGFHLIRNPDSGKVCEFEFLPSFPGVKWVALLSLSPKVLICISPLPLGYVDSSVFTFSPDGRSIILYDMHDRWSAYNFESGLMQR